MHILAITGDWHVGDTCALCPPRVSLQSATYRPSKLQRAIHRAWIDYWSLVSSLKSQHSAHVIGIHNGDLGDLNYHSTKELFSTYRPDIESALVDVFQPASKITDTDIVIRGTSAHNGGCGELEEWFASDINAEKSPEGTRSWFVFRAEINGVLVHVTHHPPTSTRIVTKQGQTVSRMCERLAGEYNHFNWRKPHLAFWSHIHWSSRGWEEGIEGWTTPCWKGLGAFGHRIGVSLPNPVGGLIVLLPGDGTWKVNQFLRHPPRLPLWKPS